MAAPSRTTPNIERTGNDRWNGFAESFFQPGGARDLQGDQRTSHERQEKSQ
jgi:hypothetical protein